MTSRYRDLSLGPPYLRPENFERLKGLVDRVRVHTGELEGLLFAQPQGTYSKANLSDIFEYMSESLNEQVFRALGTQLRSGGRVAYWNLLVPRTSPASLRHLLAPLGDLSAALFQQDRSWFYRAFHVEEVCR